MASKSSKGQPAAKRGKTGKKAATKDLPVQSGKAGAVKGGTGVPPDPWQPGRGVGTIQTNPITPIKTIKTVK